VIFTKRYDVMNQPEGDVLVCERSSNRSFRVRAEWLDDLLASLHAQHDFNTRPMRTIKLNAKFFRSLK